MLQNVLARKSVLNSDLPVLSAEKDDLSEQMALPVAVCASYLAQAVRISMTAGAPNKFPEATSPITFTTFANGMFGELACVVAVGRCLTDPSRLLVKLTCPQRPQEIIRRRHNLVAALQAHYVDDADSKNTISLIDVKTDGTLVYVLPDDN